MAGTKAPSTTLGSAADLIVIECVNANGRYSKLLVNDSRPHGLKFRNGRATITKAELEELMAEPVWKRQIDVFGRLRTPGRIHQPTVIRGIDASGIPPAPTDAQTGKSVTADQEEAGE
jgi:hypothetical protein